MGWEFWVLHQIILIFIRLVSFLCHDIWIFLDFYYRSFLCLLQSNKIGAFIQYFKRITWAETENDREQISGIGFSGLLGRDWAMVRGL